MQTMTRSAPPARHKFQFSNPSAQAAEARLNAREALKFCERWVEPGPSEQTEEEPTSAAGACFRRVQAILAGKKGGGK